MINSKVRTKSTSFFDDIADGDLFYFHYYPLLWGRF